MFGQDIELGHVPVLPAICLGAGLLDERDKPSVGENFQSFSRANKTGSSLAKLLGCLSHQSERNLVNATAEII